MFHSLFLRLLGVILALTMIGEGIPAYANNIPGSAATAIPEATEIATGMIVRSIKNDMRGMRAGGRGSVAVTSAGRIDSFGAATGGDTPVSLDFGYRDLSTDRLDGSLMTGTLLAGRQIDDRILVFGGLLAERLNADTSYNAGHLDGTGFGLAAGIDYRASEALYLTGILGLMDLNYDVSRNAGAATGSFDARRTFLDLSGDYFTRMGGADVRLGFGLLYVNQRNDGYSESGGAVIGAYTDDQLSGKLSARSTWGDPGAFRPYVDAEAWLHLAGSSGLPPLLAPADTNDFTQRLAIGMQRTDARSNFDLGLGANFGDGSFDGLDAQLSYTLRF